MYVPRRDHRFEYVTEVAEYVENKQCVSCIFRDERDEFLMCLEIEGRLLVEQPIDEWTDQGDDGVSCDKWRFGG